MEILTFMRTHGLADEMLVDVNMKQEVEKSKCINGKIPTIVVDLFSINGKIETYKHEILLGGRYNVYVERITYVLRKLKSTGANLIFFVDGQTQETNINSMLCRSNEKYNQEISVLNSINNGNDLRFFEGSNIPQAPEFFSVLKSIARNFGKVYTANLNKYKLELACFASEYDAMAIISNDSDFLIFEGNWQFWSSKDINFETLKTKKYSKEKLFTTLELSGKQIQLFATLVGNNIMPYDTVKDFHKLIAGNETYIEGIAAFIKRLGKTDSSQLISTNLWIVSLLIFSWYYRPGGIALMQTSIDSYDYARCIREYKSELIMEASKSKFNYIILADIPYVVELYFIDIRQGLMSIYNIISPIIKRIMGILLYNKNPNIRRTFYCKTCHYGGYEEISEKPEYPEFPVHDVLELIRKPIGNKNFDNMRYSLLCWAVSEKLDADKIKELPSQSLLDVLALFYLCELRQISVNEADCILIACRYSSLGRYILTLDNVTTFKERDARIAFLFPVIRTYMKRVICAVGLNNKSICTNPSFDGLYFHFLRKTWEITTPNYHKNILTDCENLRLYASGCAQ